MRPNPMSRYQKWSDNFPFDARASRRRAEAQPSDQMVYF